MGGGREPGHVRAGLGDDHLRDLRPDPGDGLQQLDLVLPRLAGLGDHRVQLGQGLLDQVQPTQHRAGQPGVVGVEVPGQRLGQIGDLAPHPALRQLGEPQRIGFAVDHRGQHRPRRHRLQARRDRGQLDAGVLQHQLQPDDLPGPVTHQLHPVPGQHPQPADLRWRHERRRQQPVLQQLRDPLRVPDIALAARHGLHVRGVQQPHLHHLLQAVERRLPIRRRRLHRRDRHPGLDQPVPHHPQRPGRRLERPRLRVPPARRARVCARTPSPTPCRHPGRRPGRTSPPSRPSSPP